MSEAQRKRAFAIVAVVVAAAVGLLLVLDREEDVGPAAGPGGVVVPSPTPQDRAASADSVPRTPASARSVARRFAVAYLARDGGLDGADTWDDLRGTTSTALWQSLREPVRIPPSTHPAPAVFERVAGVSETASPGEIAATVEYHRSGERRYLRLVLINESATWRVTRLSP